MAKQVYTFQFDIISTGKSNKADDALINCPLSVIEISTNSESEEYETI